MQNSEERDEFEANENNLGKTCQKCRRLKHELCKNGGAVSTQSVSRARFSRWRSTQSAADTHSHHHGNLRRGNC